MKRFGQEGEVDSIHMANVLMLLSRGREDDQMDQKARTLPGRVFECKTCNRQFPSFQALGGHRTSHKKPRLLGDNQSQAQSAVAKPRVHECSICGLEFAIGQALGGHMRRHRAASAQGLSHGLVEKKSKVLLLDLNMPPSDDDDIECRKLLGPGLDFVDKTPMVDCFH